MPSKVKQPRHLIKTLKIPPLHFVPVGMTDPSERHGERNEVQPNHLPYSY